MSEPKHDPQRNDTQARIEEAGAKLARALNWSDRPPPVLRQQVTTSAEPPAQRPEFVADRMLQRLVRLLAGVVVIQLIAGLVLMPSPATAVSLSRLACIVLFIGGFLGLPRSLFLPAIVYFGMGLGALALGDNAKRAMFLLAFGMALTWAFPGCMVGLLFTQVRRLPLPDRVLGIGVLCCSALLTLSLLVMIAMLASQRSR